MPEKVWIITAPDGTEWFDDHAKTYQEAVESAVCTFGDGSTVEQYI